MRKSCPRVSSGSATAMLNANWGRKGYRYIQVYTQAYGKLKIYNHSYEVYIIPCIYRCIYNTAISTFSESSCTLPSAMSKDHTIRDAPPSYSEAVYGDSGASNGFPPSSVPAVGANYGPAAPPPAAPLQPYTGFDYAPSHHPDLNPLLACHALTVGSKMGELDAPSLPCVVISTFSLFDTCAVYDDTYIINRTKSLFVLLLSNKC